MRLNAVTKKESYVLQTKARIKFRHEELSNSKFIHMHTRIHTWCGIVRISSLSKLSKKILRLRLVETKKKCCGFIVKNKSEQNSVIDFFFIFENKLYPILVMIFFRFIINWKPNFNFIFGRNLNLNILDGVSQMTDLRNSMQPQQGTTHKYICTKALIHASSPAVSMYMCECVKISRCTWEIRRTNIYQNKDHWTRFGADNFYCTTINNCLFHILCK